MLGTEALGRLDGFIDDDAVRHIDALAQFIRGDAQYRAFNRIDARDLAVEKRTSSST